jgi:DNA-binding transcriptional LysR family regulator
VNLASRDLNLLIALQALLEEKNVTRAGERLGVGQSTMSGALARLRSHYGDELLVRVGRDFDLTPLARNLAVEVQVSVPLIERALGIGDEFTPATAVRRFVISASDYACLELHDALRCLHAIAPGISIDYSPVPQLQADWLRDMRQSDFMVAPPDIDAEGEGVPLFSDHYVCVLDTANPALDNGTLSWSAFSELPLAMPNLGASQRRPVERRLAELGYHHRPTVLTQGLVSVGSLVSGTHLVAIVPARLAARLVPLERVMSVQAPFGRVEYTESLWWHPARRADPGIRWLRQLLLSGIS